MEKTTLKTDRTKVKRVPKRGVYDQQTVYSILDAAYLAQIGFIFQNQPFVIPTLYGRLNDCLYIHGATSSRMLKSIINHPICFTVSLVDGIVLARSAFHHSMNYRSAVLLGSPSLVEDPEEKKLALKIISDHLIPDRWEESRLPNSKELKATTVLKLAITEASAKIRTGDPVDDKEDHQLNIWAGQIPLKTIALDPINDALLRSEIPLSKSAQKYIRQHQ